MNSKTIRTIAITTALSALLFSAGGIDAHVLPRNDSTGFITSERSTLLVLNMLGNSAQVPGLGPWPEPSSDSPIVSHGIHGANLGMRFP